VEFYHIVVDRSKAYARNHRRNKHAQFYIGPVLLATIRGNDANHTIVTAPTLNVEISATDTSIHKKTLYNLPMYDSF
jgi:ectoine hydroxylase-related dioxygenase (phytanoyl-CoA dioxygenase family)